MLDSEARRKACIGKRPEVKYKSCMAFYPEPHLAIKLSELMHDVDISNNKLLNELVSFAMDHVKLKKKVVKEVYAVSFDTKSDEGRCNE